MPAAGRKEHRHDRPHGGRHLPRQAPGDRVPIARDLRRAALVLGLRSARGRDPPEHPQRAGGAPWSSCATTIVGLEAAIIMSPKVWEAQRPRRRLLRPARRVPRTATSGSAPTTWSRTTAARLSELRRHGVHRAEAVQPDVQDAHGSGRGRLGRRLPAPRDRAGDVRRLPAGPDGRAQEAAVRDRPDRQVVPQRDHAGQLHLPHARVRADGDGVLRRARHRRGVVRVLGGRAAAAGTWTSACRRRSCACGRTIPTSWRTTRRPRPTSSTSSRSAGASWRASRTGPTST